MSAPERSGVAFSRVEGLQDEGPCERGLVLQAPGLELALDEQLWTDRDTMQITRSASLGFTLDNCLFHDVEQLEGRARRFTIDMTVPDLLAFHAMLGEALARMQAVGALTSSPTVPVADEDPAHGANADLGGAHVGN